MDKSKLNNLHKAGEITKKTVEYAKSIIKPGAPLLEIAEKIEKKIIELGGKPAFPVNLAMNEVAAHYTPSSDSKEKADGLLKIDIGVHINGDIVDTAFSIDLTQDKKYTKLIEASEEALKAALKTSEENKKKTQLREIGKAIQEKIQKAGFSPVRNLCGHGLGDYTIHSGITIPNYDNENSKELGEGVFAIEPFATTGEGIVQDGASSGIYSLEEFKATRNPTARKILEYVEKEYKTLPFCERWIENKFGSGIRLAISFLVRDGILHEYPQLVEKSKHPVSQAEHTILISDKVEVLS